MSRVATATSSPLAADAASDIAADGGNAIDCALAAALVAMNTEPGVCALAGGAYVTVWPGNGDPVTIDGNVAVPGLGGDDSVPATETVSMDYGGGISTLVGCSSVAVPGSLAAIAMAAERYGKLPWQCVLEPVIAATRRGFPLSSASHYYLQYAGKPVFGKSRDGYAALHDEHEHLRQARSAIEVPHLADSLEQIAREGSRCFYHGDIARAIVAHVRNGGGKLTAEDMVAYQAIPRRPLLSTLGKWQIATNPPPAVGGTVLTAMLATFEREPITRWDAATVERLVDVQKAVLRFRRERLDLSDDIVADCNAMLQAVDSVRYPGPYSSAATVHTSSVDNLGNACAVTASSGYGSGEMPDGTGLWLNNCLGELELNRRGLAAGPHGVRLPSNMTPGAARNCNKVLAFGSPGADRITTAIQQFLLRFMQQGLSLAEAVAAPRLHVELPGAADRVASEPGLALPPLSVEVRQYPALNMYFGGVGAALYDSDGDFEVAADPRREGGTCIVGQ